MPKLQRLAELWCEWHYFNHKAELMSSKTGRRPAIPENETEGVTLVPSRRFTDREL
jgi:hypothetical protein